ncbi:interferon gamma receptor 2 isoform X1 [Labrus bergylta]|uniref:interferon gamma receptor 2 isoform X1 n=1 Tax=Labrus bergylta TaxID=56723 RepID=UPI0033138C69
MILMLLLLTQAFLSVLSEEPPPPPQHVHVNKWLLTWTPPTAETDLTYTVQSSFHSDEWTDVPICVHTASTSCDVALTAAENEHGCVMLRVQAERRGLKSTPVQACSSQSDSCTPEVSLSGRPGFLTIHLSRNHSLAQNHAAHAAHRVHYSREGDTTQLSEDSYSSFTLPQLEPGQRYCAQVEYILHSRPVGPPSCSLCELVPYSSETGTVVKPVVVVCVFIVLVLVLTGTAYVFICQQRRIKQWLRPPYAIPEDFHCQRHFPVSTYSPTEEHFDAITFVTPVRSLRPT